MTALRIGTRGSALALWQANTVASLLRARGAEVEIVRITTQGDRRQETPLAETSGKGLFTKEIEEALLRNEIDIAVHSAKDMAAVEPDGLTIAAVLPREDPRDAWVLPARGGAPKGTHYDSAEDTDVVRPFRVALLGDTPRIGTSSPRRVAQLRAAIPGARFQAIRGNVDTRLRKLDAGEADALVLAAAGLLRLGLGNRISTLIPVELCVPAPGQGIVAVEVRKDDERAYAQVAPITDLAARVALAAEQAVVEALGGGCQLPLGALAELRGSEIVIRGTVVSLDGRHSIAAMARSADIVDPGDAAKVGRRLAEDLLARGARKILDA